jgi:putative endonuclease
MASTAQRRRAVGQYGEQLAERRLRSAGLEVLDRNWRCPLGELDLVCRDGDDLVVVEVKTRSSELFGSPLEAVTDRKAARLRRLAARWLAEHPFAPVGVRVDVVGVLLPRRGAAQVDHLRGVA